MNPESLHEPNGHVDEGETDDFPCNGNLNVGSGIGSREKYRAHELARHIPRNRRPATFEPFGMNTNRRTPISALTRGIPSESAQRIEQIGDRAFTHAWAPIDPELAASQRNQAYEETHCGACIPGKEFGPRDRKHATATLDANLPRRAIPMNPEPESPECIKEMFRVVTLKSGSEMAFALGESCYHERPVRQTF
jgi:hypothetical protein